MAAGDDVPKKKPDPEVYKKAAATLGVQPSECVCIEDSTTGMQAALQAGRVCKALVILSPWTMVWDEFVSPTKAHSRIMEAIRFPHNDRSSNPASTHIGTGTRQAARSKWHTPGFKSQKTNGLQRCQLFLSSFMCRMRVIVTYTDATKTQQQQQQTRAAGVTTFGGLHQ
eukprot:1161664-Pelagomonas_calceolata.AAC.7